MISRKASLYKDYRKEGDPLETVAILHLKNIGDVGSIIVAASVERENGEVLDVYHDRLKFIP